ncbi:MAG: ABC transporter ATP-binding protein [Deltaproteobacteria bacterium]|nr:ABC transporter ATP-binding protein [Deltaproteobacteria bacterium]
MLIFRAALADTVLEIRDLVTTFSSDEGVIRAVDGLSLTVPAGTTVGVVGESGCGKSVTALSILRLVQSPGRIESGQILFQGQDLLKLSEARMRELRGARISMIFQEPMTSLNPVFTVGDQIMEAILLHQSPGRRAARARAIELMQLCGIPAPEDRVDSYPHELSGGMRQRIMIAMALACNPSILLADEPTTALDVTIQAQILDLLGRLQRELGMSIVLITHDLGVVAEFATRVVVMYAGKVVEQGSTEDLFHSPSHPYTRGLLRSIPKLDEKTDRAGRLPAIRGMVPDLRHLPPGCRFEDRCEEAFERCRTAVPPLYEVTASHLSRCYLCSGEADTRPLERSDHG